MTTMMMMMIGSVLPSRKRRRASFAVVSLAIGVAALGASSSRAEAPEAVVTAPAAAVHRGAIPFADRLPNLVLKTHEGRNVRFYDDLLKDKIVLINFMYATCKER